ncbi:carboxyvinyl-carboxyphosphonate phosphorylmutase [Chryseobacterium piperi]|uniref:Carboxyvinyl-carboxyphosphonate phosphorylmutase n=1 Tax=Chryseobacterium piperi TaxID=558152 RepID=A0A086BJK1_9FLAO|nr:isocitrate lyase/phosphoenolpyruvate mutase family protein [Chryseobacterium piperi]ASW74008.1 isocitrate lyase/phosphoenolpyruvate mutase family protein [Chryseobacterium piperi]KFF29115.1 carboxyvinyl-carboxyphosphonate phosphorylmutase [Chryseobacterium piperi]
MKNTQIFKELHHQDELLLIGNVWNAQSAKIYERLGYKAIATSSSAVAHSLGYEDGEEMSFDEYLYIIERILKSVSLPLSVDLEAGYGNNADEVVSNISKLASMGVVGVNIEDSIVADGTREILDKGAINNRLGEIMAKLKEQNVEMFINLRTDPFLLRLENPLNETLERIKLLETIEVNGIFVPCITAEQDIQTVVGATKLPVNVMCMPDLPDFETLKNLGVRRISLGNFLNGYIYNHLETAGREIIDQQNFSPIFM